MAEKVYFTSLGALAKSDIHKSISAFSDLLKTESSFPYFTTARITASLFVDSYYYKTIDSYKLGYISTDEFKTRISNQLGIEKNAKFESAWNAMCELSKEASTQIIRLFQHQEAEHFKLCIVSATNSLQYDYVVKQINLSLKNSNLSTLDDNLDIVMVTSFEEHTLLLPELARIAIDKNNWDLSQYTIVSYDDRLTKENLMLEKAEFIYDQDHVLLSLSGENSPEL